MTNNLVFTAPWAKSLIIVSFLCSIIILATSIYSYIELRQTGFWTSLMVIAAPLIIIFVVGLFSIRGYKLTNNYLYIQRIGWNSQIELSNLVSVEFNPTAMNKSIRLWGNGGFFSITGKYRNSQLGNFNAYATDPKRSVVLKFPEKTIVITPNNPSRFVEKIIEHQNV